MGELREQEMTKTGSNGSSIDEGASCKGGSEHIWVMSGSFVGAP